MNKIKALCTCTTKKDFLKKDTISNSRKNWKVYIGITPGLLCLQKMSCRPHRALMRKAVCGEQELRDRDEHQVSMVL